MGGSILSSSILDELGPSPPRCPPWRTSLQASRPPRPYAHVFLPKETGSTPAFIPSLLPSRISLRAPEEPMVDEAGAEPAGCSLSRLTVGKGLQGPPQPQHLRHGGGLQAFHRSSGLPRTVTALPCKEHPTGWGALWVPVGAPGPGRVLVAPRGCHGYRSPRQRDALPARCRFPPVPRASPVGWGTQAWGVPHPPTLPQHPPRAARACSPPCAPVPALAGS